MFGYELSYTEIERLFHNMVFIMWLWGTVRAVNYYPLSW